MSIPLKPPCSNINATQIQMLNVLNKEVAQEGTLSFIINHTKNNSKSREHYYNLYINFSQKYRDIYEKGPTTAIGKVALLESIHYEFCAVIIDYSAKDFGFATKAASRIQNNGQHWKIDNLKEFLEDDALDASLHIKDFGIFTYYNAGYLQFVEEDGTRITIMTKSEC